MKLLTRFEEHLLISIARLGDKAYGVSIRRELKEVTGSAPSHGAIHTTMERLEKLGYVASRLSEPENRRGGRSKRIYKLRPAGYEALREIQRVQQELWFGLPNLLGGEG